MRSGIDRVLVASSASDFVHAAIAPVTQVSNVLRFATFDAWDSVGWLTDVLISRIDRDSACE